MRRTTISIILATTFAFGATACTADDEAGDPSATGPVATTAAADLTAATSAACTEAVELSTSGAAAFEEDIAALLETVIEGDEAAATAAEEAFRAKLTSWSDRLTELAGQEIEPGVSTALTEAATLIVRINDPDNDTPVETAKKELADAAAKIQSACA